MSKLFLWMGCLMICLVLVGCQDGLNQVEEPDSYTDANGHSIGTPYWWRTHPDFKDIKVDEEATLAAGDPFLVIHADDPIEVMHDKLIETLGKQYNDREVVHLIGHHRDHLLAMEIPDVNMSLLEDKLPSPLPNEVVYNHCDCPFEGDNDEECDTGSGGGSPPPPPLTPDPHTNTHMHTLGDVYYYPEDLPANRGVRAYMSTISLNGINMVGSKLKNIRIEKDGLLAYSLQEHVRHYTQVHSREKSFSYGDPVPVSWVTSLDHHVFDYYTQGGFSWMASSSATKYY